MGILYSVKEVQDHIETLKHKVQNFNGTYNSKDYHKLQKEIMQTNTALLKMKKSQKSTNSRREFEKLWNDLNECTQILRERVGRNSLPPGKIKTEPKEVSIPRRTKQEAIDIINNLEEETKNIEEEIEKMLQTNDYKKQAILEGKMKVFFTDLTLTKTENGSYLDVRKNEILQRLLACYKQVRDGSSTRTSMVSNIFYIEEPSKPKHTKLQAQKVPKAPKRTIIIPKIPYEEDFDDLLNIDDCQYEDMTYYGNRTSTLSTKQVKANLDELLEDDLYDHAEMDGFLNEVLEVTNQNEHYENIVKQSEKINSLHDELIKIKDEMEDFAGIYKDEEYLEIENNLEKCLDKFNQIDDLGDESIINGKEEHLAYIETLREYLEGKAKLDEEEIEEEPNSDSDSPEDDFIRKKIYPPILKPVSSSSSEEEEEANISSKPTRKIYPPIVRPVSTHEDCSSSSEEEEENQDESKQSIKKINPPILKVVDDETTEEDMSDEESSRLNENGFGDEDQVECDSNQEDNNEEFVSDALNIELLKRISSVDDSHVSIEENSEEEYDEEIDGSTKVPETIKETEEEQEPRTNLNNVKNKIKLRNRGKGYRSVLVDYTEKIKEVLEDIEELKNLNETFKETQNYKLYGEIQEKLMQIIRIMFDMDKSKFDKNSLVVYEIVSQNIQTFVNEL